MGDGRLRTTSPRPPSHLTLQSGGGTALLACIEGPQLSTCGQHQGLPCGGTAWVSERGPCCFPTDDLRHSWVAARSCSGTWFPIGVHLILSCKGNARGVTHGPLGRAWPHQTNFGQARRGQHSVLCSGLLVGQLGTGPADLQRPCCPRGRTPGLSQPDGAAPPHPPQT